MSTMTSSSWPVLAFFLFLATYLIRQLNYKDDSSRKTTPLKAFDPSSAAGTAAASETKEQAPKIQVVDASDVETALPPSRRDQLNVLLPTLSPSQQKAMGDPSAAPPSSEWTMIGLDEDYMKADDNKYLPTGLSVREIKALGDFPDYCTLAGIPAPEPYVNFNINTARPRPSRPFRWPYHQTMTIKKYQHDWWVELESTYKERIAQRKALYEKHGDLIAQWLPGSELACKELMEMLIDFICARYPHYFTLSDDKRWLTNKILGTRDDIRAKHPLLVLMDHVPEEYAIMIRDPTTGLYTLRAGSICSALGFNIATKMGLTLPEIHEPVPHYKEKMEFSMNRFFSKLPTDRPIQRASWELVADQPLFMAPDDPRRATVVVQEEDLTADRLHLRVDWQTLRRLPLSGAIIFNFKALFTSLEDMRDEPYTPSLLLKMMTEGDELIMKYRNTWHVEHVAIPFLEDIRREQEEKGLIEKDWEVATLEDSPYYPGWEEKWHAQQGF